MSMADVSGSPLHMFDEPDVFMDDQTRTHALGMMVRLMMADKRGKQFIIFTPHAVRCVRSGPCARRRARARPANRAHVRLRGGAAAAMCR